MPKPAGSVLAFVPADPTAVRVAGGATRGGAEELRSLLEDVLADRLRWCESLGELLGEVARHRWAAILIPLDEAEVEAPVVRRIAENAPDSVLLMTAPRTGVEEVLRAEAMGAAALLPHPPTRERLAAELCPLVEEGPQVEVTGTSPEAEADPGPIGTSPAFVEVYRHAVRVASARTTVLVTGESGTGKELVARILHRAGPRRDGPFVPVNCAALPDSLLEAELFGYERGAFTGAQVRSEGRFGRAHGGTLFLDEVGEMSLPLQAKLLRVLETGEVERLGAREVVEVDVRVVAATNRDLRAEVEAGRFREDLLYRMAVVELELPPLRERPEDVLPLALHFARRFAERHGRRVRALSRPAADALLDHGWPGNVRELRNVLDRAVLLARGGVIRRADLQLGRYAPRASPPEDAASRATGFPTDWSLRRVEGAHIRAVLERTGGHMGDAARILGIHRNTMTSKVRDHGLEPGSGHDDGTPHASVRL